MVGSRGREFRLRVWAEGGSWGGGREWKEDMV